MPVLVRDVMTIGVPVCRDTETCGAVAARLEKQGGRAEVVVVLDEAGRAVGWMTREQLVKAASTQTVGTVMDEDIPTVLPDVSLDVAAQLMQNRSVNYLFLMHRWPGEPRPSAVISRQTIDYLREGQRPKKEND